MHGSTAILDLGWVSDALCVGLFFCLKIIFLAWKKMISEIQSNL